MAALISYSKEINIKFNREQLAWAAGFFDGEGSCVLCRHPGRAYVNPVIAISQCGDPPMALMRFRNAVGGIGTIYDKRSCVPSRLPAHQYHVHKFEHVQAVIAMLWSFLSEPKRQQAKATLEGYRNAKVLKRRRVA